jgi:von Willebrand factor type A domain
MHFLTPSGAIVAVVVVVPLVAFFIADRQRRRVTALLRLEEPRAMRRLAPAVAVCVAAALLGIAATQPTVVARSTQQIRTDAEAWFVLDTSLSMSAATSPTSPTRFQRAQALATRLREQLRDVPVGVASITDRALPHLFPTIDLAAFDLTVRKAVGIERPPPSDGFSVRITTLGSLARLVSDNFFSPSATKRLVVVFTDGETRPFADASLGTVFNQPPGLHAIFVRIWGGNERVWDGNRPDPLYRPDPASAEYVQQLADTTNGVALRGSNFDGIVRDARGALGSGPHLVLRKERRQRELAPLFAAFAFLPLGFLLWRRNV